MILFDLFKILADARIQLSMENGALKVDAPKGAVTPAILAELKKNKEELLKYLQKAQDQGRQLSPVSRDLPLRLSYGQQRLWLLDRIDGGSAHYNMPAALKLEGALNLDALDQAFTTILARHESLRTCFTEGGDGQPLQVIQAAAPLAVEVTDLSALAGVERQVKLVELLTEEAG
ncbi:MAG: condensation domain-containing protein, partial [Telluria sp.]